MYINKCKKSRYYDYCTKFITRRLNSNNNGQSEEKVVMYRFIYLSYDSKC